MNPYMSDFQKIGVFLTGFGLFFMFLGILLLFDRGLLTIGNILFFSGVTLVIGIEKTAKFFLQPRKAKASGAFFGGIFIILFGWTFIGMMIELYGIFLLFSGFLPVIFSFLYRVPVVGQLLQLPGVRTIVQKLGESGNPV